MTPPERLSNATFSTYRPVTESQQKGKEIVEAFVEHQYHQPSLWHRLTNWLGDSDRSPQGVYLVGPVGTGKSHLLASAYHALEPYRCCCYLHMSTITRLSSQPRFFATSLAEEYDVVCIDELEIDDAANEARLVTILSVLDDKNVGVLASSNVTPSAFMANKLGTGRFSQFLENHFQESYQLVWMEGEDFRTNLPSSGYAWVGCPEKVREKMEAHYTYQKGESCWLEFDDFLERSESTPHETLVDELIEHDALYLNDIEIGSSDDALRLLRVVDDLYTLPDPPTLYFTSPLHPDKWLGEHQNGSPTPVATKFKRTISRIKAMCTIERFGSATISR